jgi:hypothetical protein
MGNQCCGAPEKMSMEDINTIRTIKVYGDIFTPELRSIISCLQFCGTKYIFTEVDTLVGDNLEEPYLELNPTG